MRNITVSVPDDAYTGARLYAARYNTSVSAVVADYLFTLRMLARKKAHVTPGAAADLHCEFLRESPGRVHGDLRNTREVLQAAKALLGQ
jgi:hypothetical protein